MKHGLAVCFFLPAVAACTIAYAEAAPAEVCYIPVQQPAALAHLNATDPTISIASDSVALSDNQNAQFNGNVEISYRDTLLLAPRASFSSISQTMTADGGLDYFNSTLQVSGSRFR